MARISSLPLATVLSYTCSMSESGLWFTGLVLLVAGFTLWFYGFVYSSFWYANVDLSVLEPVRVWVSGLYGAPVSPGFLEELMGLLVALSGIALQVLSYFVKR